MDSPFDPKETPSQANLIYSIFSDLKSKAIDTENLSRKGKKPYGEETKEYESAKRAIENADLMTRVIAKSVLTIVVLAIIIFWLNFIAKILLNSGWKNQGFYLSDKVIITLLTTTTANVLVMMHFIVKHFFPTTEEFSKLRQKQEK